MKVDIFNTDKKYNVIYADPPWHFGSKEIQKYKGERFRPLDTVYNTVKTEEMCLWDIKRITEKDCAIFMWVTDAHMKEGLKLMEAWGFKYITVAFVWEKLTSNGKRVVNLGAWTMKNCELCLLGTKGAMLKYKKANNIQQLVCAERQAHSKKPDEVRQRIKALFGDIPCIELFARQQADGWDCWGNEV